MTQQEFSRFFEMVTEILNSVANLDKKVESVQGQVNALVESRKEEAGNWAKILDPETGLFVRVKELEEEVAVLKQCTEVKQKEKKERNAKIAWALLGGIATLLTTVGGALIMRSLGIVQ